MITHVIQALVLMVALWSSWNAIGNYGSALLLFFMKEGKYSAERVHRSNINLYIASILWALFWYMS